MNLKGNQFTYFEKLDAKGGIKAKEDKTLQEHSFDVAVIANEIGDNLHIRGKNTWWSGFEETLKELIVYSAYVHDAGKADRRWQDYIKEEKKEAIVPHPLFSLPVARKYLEDNLKIKQAGIRRLFINLGLLSIATHHSPFENDRYRGYEDWMPDYSFEVEEDSSLPYNLFKEAGEQILCMRNQKEGRYLYVLINGVLSLADWIASMPNMEHKRFDGDELNRCLINYFKNEIKKQPYSYQEDARGIKEDVLIQLPTGCGKTETALWWLTKHECNKVFYTLPTVTTVEAMRKRFEKIFGRERVTFAHHLLQISLMDEERLTEEELFIQKHLLKPIAVTTIDRIILAMMNYKRYTVSEVMLNNAALVIDEIHSYSPFTFSLIVEALKYLKEYHNVRLCIMSATLPEVIKDAFSDSDEGIGLKFNTLIPKGKIKEIYGKKKRTKISGFYEGELIEDNVGKIIEAMRGYKKVLVVVNTVSKAQKLYDEIKRGLRSNIKAKVMLFHSRFIYRDKGKKQRDVERLEKENKESVVLISTQIVEVSLDIDYDVLFTEIAPFDAIIQRAGRVNRKGKKEVSGIYIFDVEDDEKGYLPYKEKQIKEARAILSKIEVKSELDYLERNNEFYESLRSFYEDELKEKRLEGFLGQIYEKGNIDKALQTRDGFLTVPVVPVCFEEEIEETKREIGKIKEKLKAEKSKELRNERLNLMAEMEGYFVPVPLYTAKTAGGFKSSDSSIHFIQLKYDEEKGILREEEESKVIIL